MKILITGINGFVGSNFVKSWKDIHTLYGLDILQRNKDGVEQIFSWEEFDKIPKVDSIIHLAGIAHDTKDKTKKDIYFQVNTGLTKKVFDYFLDSKIKTFIYFSSVKAAADIVDGDFLTEEVVPKPVGAYGESKIKAEEYILSYKEHLKSKNKKVYILRPAMIHGTGNKGNLNLLYKLVSKGIPWPLGAYENKRSFCSINNITYVVEKLFLDENDNVENGIYNVCDDKPISTNELIKLISQSVDKKAKIWSIPKWIMSFFANIGSFLHLPLNKDRLQKLTENYIVSNDKIKAALNVENFPTDVETGLKQTLKSFQNN